MQYNQITHAFFDPDSGRTIDALHPETQRGVYGGRTLAETRAEYPAAIVADLDEIAALHDKKWSSPPREITADEYHDMLNVLPPAKWTTVSGISMFAMSERTSGNITQWYASAGGRYFVAAQSIFADQDELRRMFAGAAQS